MVKCVLSSAADAPSHTWLSSGSCWYPVVRRVVTSLVAQFFLSRSMAGGYTTCQQQLSAARQCVCVCVCVHAKALQLASLYKANAAVHMKECYSPQALC